MYRVYLCVMRCPIVSRSAQGGEIQVTNFGVDFRREFCYEVGHIFIHAGAGKARHGDCRGIQLRVQLVVL